MVSTPDESISQLRRTVYWLLIVTSAGGMIGRILTVSAAHGRTPFHSANDRSRWCTIRSLVDHGTYVIDDVIYNPRTGKHDHPHWNSIDKVRHKGADGHEHFYSSKPTLLPTLLAGQYWLIQKITGAMLEHNSFYVARVMLIITNVLPLIVYFVLLARLVEQYGRTNWGRIFVMACATWGTFLTTFSVTLNNHVPAAICVVVALYATIKIWNDAERRWWYFAIAGLAAAFAAANELPALSFTVVIAAAVFWKSPKQTLIGFVPAAAIVAFGFFYTNHLAHNSWRTAYAHRKDGPVILSFKLDDSVKKTIAEGEVPQILRSELQQLDQPIELSSETQILLRPNNVQDDSERWMLWDAAQQLRLALNQNAAGELLVQQWDNWYEYEGSYWLDGAKRGVDLGEPSRFVYAFHLTFGHHGIFSLTPMWLLAVCGMMMLLFNPAQCSIGFRWLDQFDQWLEGSRLRQLAGKHQYQLRMFAMMVLVISLVVIAFYIARPMKDRNYGGVTCGLRWLFWLAPMWLLCMIPAADSIASKRLWKFVAYGVLAVSVFSTSYACLNPWSHPWMYAYLQYLGG